MQLQLRAQAAGLPALTRAPSRARVALRAAQVQTESAPAATDAPSSSGDSDGQADIYIGFAKGDYAPRTGRKGRVVKDDPRKYPGKEDLGVFQGAVGGWAGGEAALWKLREEVIAQKQQQKGGAAPAAAAAAAPAKPAVPKPQGEKQPIYIGYGKSDLDLRRAGAPGRFILDDPTKYPAKEDLGFFAGATGGFAAGEKGLQQFLRDGELQLRRAGQPGGNQFSPVALAGLLVLAGAGGGLLLNGLADVTEEGIKSVPDLVGAPVDDNTRTLLLVAVGLIGSAGALAAGRAALSSLQEQASATAQKVLLLGGFWIAVFLAARAVLAM